ncbi:MAG: TolB-like 6-bladed beta-propeller domain-containing protein [Prevotellaceae bacterium]|nr:TolB-like 6-bladed beta-propeller domain-containing protein [Prevotellaceae bacterium]
MAIIFFILLNACGKPSTDIDDFPIIHNIADYDSIYSDKNDAPLGMIAGIEVVDNVIITQNMNDDYFFAFIDVDKGELLTRWGTRGQSPDEYIQISRSTVSENRLVFIDRGKQKIIYVPLSIILKQDTAANVIKESYTDTPDFRTRYLTVIGNKKIVAGSFKEGHFGILDAENRIVSHPFDFPFNYREINGIYRGSTFQSLIKSNSKQCKFAISILCSDIFEIYQISDTGIVITYISPFKHIPQITKKPREYSTYAVDYYNSISGLKDMAVSDDFICFSYSSKSYEETVNSGKGFNEILCFNWMGEKVKKYILPFNIHTFCIDNNCIYGVRYYDDEIIFYRFNMAL